MITLFLTNRPGYLAFFLVIGLLVALTACQAPTPPPSPTPWPTDTLTPISATATPEPTVTSTLTPTPTPEPLPSPTPPETTIVIWENLSPAQAEALAEEIKAFEGEFPQFKVSRQHFDSPENFMTPLMAGAIDFDVVLAPPVLLGSLWATEQIAPMSDFFPPGFIDGFASVTLQGASRDQKLWGVPDTAGFHLLLIYNREVIDTPPANTDELFELAQSSLSRPGGARWGLGLNSFDPLWLVPWLTAYGGWLTDETGQPTLNTPAMEAAIELYLSWLGRSASQESDQEAIAPVATLEESRSLFLEGEVAMLIDGEWAIVELAQTDKIKWGVAPLPDVSLIGAESEPAAPLVLARYWGISRSVSGNKALAAAAFVEYMTRPERQLDLMAQFGLLPTRRQALNDLSIINEPTLRVSAAQMQAGRMIPLGTNANTILNAMRDPLQNAIEGKLTPTEAAEMMQQNVN
jgi:arabinogalactan oligomer/maltooligosaccharide transport system substrate-binding protein